MASGVRHTGAPMGQRPDRRGRATLLLLAVYALGAAVLFIPFLTREREVFDSTPNPPPLFSVEGVSFAPGVDMCVAPVTLTPSSQVLRLRAVRDFGAPGTPVDVLATGAGYSYAGRVEVARIAPRIELPIAPPKRPVSARVCLHNHGRVGILLVASQEPRTQSESTTTFDGKPLAPDVTLQVLERRPASLAGRLSTVIGHAATFRPGSAALLWIFVLLVLVGAPLGVAAAFRAAGPR